LREGHKLGLDAVHQGPLDKYRGKHVDQKSETSRDADIEGVDQDQGDHRTSSVCDVPDGLRPRCRTRSGAAGARHRALRVIDASAMPDLTSGNISAPVLIIAEKGADHVLGRRLPRAEAP